jgi:hypothetical protein
MNDRQSANDRLVRYLLGEALPEAEQAEIEERYFTDELYLDHVLAIEDDLIDSHIQGRLSDSDRSLFERHFLASKRRREKWEAQRAIASFFRSRSEPAGFVGTSIRYFGSLALGARLLLGISAVAVVLGIGFLGWGYVNIRHQSGVLQSRLAALQEQAAGVPHIATFVLQSERLRSGAGNQLQIAKDTRWIVLRLELPQFAIGYSTIAAKLSSADGQDIWRQTGLPRIASSVEINLPGSVLNRGDYVLSLSAVDRERQITLPAYQFRIDR